MREIKTKYVDTTVTCACGNVMHFRSNKDSMHVETCRACHPQYTGKNTSSNRQASTVEKFNARMKKSEN